MSTLSTIIDFFGDAEIVDVLRERKKHGRHADGTFSDGRIVGLLFEEGGMAAVINAGMAVGLEKLGLTDMFDHVIGCSGGAADASYFCAHSAQSGIASYYTEALHEHFIRVRRVRNIQDLGVMERILRTERPVNVEAFFAFPGHIHVGLTNVKTGEGVFLDPRTLQDPIQAILASAAMPVADGLKTYTIYGNSYVDGSVAWPLPVSYAIDTIGCTDVLMLRAHGFASPRKSFFHHIENMLVGVFYSKEFSKVFYRRLETYDHELAYFFAKEKHSDVRTAAIYPKQTGVTRFSTNARLLRSAADAAEEYVEKLFGNQNNEA